MPETTPHLKRQETAKAAEAFVLYVSLGPGRSLRGLAESYVQQNRYKTATTALRIFSDWSVKYRWQERIEQAATARSEQMLTQAAELDAETFLITSQQLHDQFATSCPLDPQAFIKMRESVRKPVSKGMAVNVNVSLQIQQLVDKAAEEDGLSDYEKQELYDAVQRHLVGSQT